MTQDELRDFATHTPIQWDSSGMLAIDMVVGGEVMGHFYDVPGRPGLVTLYVYLKFTAGQPHQWLLGVLHRGPMGERVGVACEVNPLPKDVLLRRDRDEIVPFLTRKSA